VTNRKRYKENQWDRLGVWLVVIGRRVAGRELEGKGVPRDGLWWWGW
jgi:hypothetical protein